MEGLFVEVPRKKFKEYFSGGSEPPKMKKFEFNVNLDSEEKMYFGVSKSLQDSLPDQEEFVVKDTGRWKDMADGSTHAKAKNDKKPDLGIYPRHEAALKAVKIEKPLTEDQKHKLGKRVDFIGRVSWAWLSLSLEVKNRTETAPFSCDGGTYWLPDNDEARKSRGQLADYAKEVLARQHRQFFFMIVVIRDHARILRWDRAGAAVSRSFNYVQYPRKLGGFIYRYAKMTPVQRGFDPTATLATKEEIAILKAYISSLKDRDVSDYLRKCMNSIIDEDGKDDEDGKGKKAKDKKAKDDENDATSYEWPIYKIELDASKFVSVKRGESERENSDKAGEDDAAANIDPKPQAKRYLLVGRAMSTSLSPTGRGTKGFAAYDMTAKTHVFLKDTWRPDSARIRPEGEIYKKLAQCEVAEIATLLYCGDVGGEKPQKTCAQRPLEKEDTKVKVLARIHYRLVFEEIARPLGKYKNSLEMALAIYAALTAHRDAWEKAGILHRDISDGNIMICDDAKDEHGRRTTMAFLNDWDLAKYEHELTKAPTQKTRSGTWQFISGLLLQFPQKQHEVSDDLESFIHVINWLSFWYHKNNYSGKPEALGNTLSAIYDESSPSPDGCDTGGITKTVYLQSGRPPLKLDMDTASQGHSRLLRSLATLAKEHYESASVSQWELESYGCRGGAGNEEESTMETTIKVESKHAFHRFIPKPVDTNQEDDDMPATPPAPITREGVLSSHSAILAAFEDALSKKWKPVDKTKNLVMTYTNSGTHILRTRTGSGKRSAESSPSGGIEGDKRPSKKRWSGKRSKRAQAASEQSDESDLSAVPEEEDD
ncbi:hypothetical protein A0H81_12496 [Grifola frondosa]|uniref:Fungal-type protein kinase domain-containing protein n=1 Tax=Grifola frondosa TaxID=5627 RepID=A0A1C7LSX7_GRIFR|nr:hypothetical protein A0H81_12496 [Grifola frondosa]